MSPASAIPVIFKGM